MTVEINNVNITRTEVVLDGRGARGVNGTLTVTSASGQAVSSRVALAAIASPVNGQAAFLTEAGREGSFVFDTSNLTTSVTADSYQAIYVAPAAAPTGASGAWVRRYSGAVNATWYGAIGDGTTNNALALQAWLDRGGHLYLPAGEYYSAAKLIVRKNVIIEGAGYGFDARIIDGTSNQGYDNMPGSRIRFPAGVGGLDIQPQTTVTDVATAVAAGLGGFTQEGASGSRINNIALIGAGTGAAATGLYCRSLVYLGNVNVLFFQGKGFDFSASSDFADGNSEYGSVDLSELKNCRSIHNGSHGFHVRGREANALILDNCWSQSNGGWGFLDESVLGNNYVAGQTASNISGSYKCIGGVAASTYTGCYVEPGQVCDLSYQCVVSGGFLADVAWQYNVGTNGNPVISSGRGVDTQQLTITQGTVSGQGPITGIDLARLYRGSDRGLTLQGSTAGTYSHTLVNAADEVVAQFAQATKSVFFQGAIFINGNQVVSARQAAITNPAYAGGATPTGAEHNALVDTVIAILTRMRSAGGIAP